jgi:hypothetical protein
MYMLTWNEEEARIEASLGGRVTSAEVEVLMEELENVIESIEHPYMLLLDYSRAQAMDQNAATALFTLKDFCLENGADKIVSVVYDDEEAARHIDQRLQHVLEGREAIVAQGAEAPFLEQSAIIHDINEIRKAA